METMSDTPFFGTIDFIDKYFNEFGDSVRTVVTKEGTKIVGFVFGQREDEKNLLVFPLELARTNFGSFVLLQYIPGLKFPSVTVDKDYIIGITGGLDDETMSLYRRELIRMYAPLTLHRTPDAIQ